MFSSELKPYFHILEKYVPPIPIFAYKPDGSHRNYEP